MPVTQEGQGGCSRETLTASFHRIGEGRPPFFSALSCQLTILVFLPLESCFHVFAPWDSELYHEIIRDVDKISVGHLSCWPKSTLTFQFLHTSSTVQSGRKAILGEPVVQAPTHYSCFCSSAAEPPLAAVGRSRNTTQKNYKLTWEPLITRQPPLINPVTDVNSNLN